MCLDELLMLISKVSEVAWTRRRNSWGILCD
jgi:hypothetical protein